MINKSLLAIMCLTVLAACGIFKHSDSKVEEIPVQEEHTDVPVPQGVDGEPSQADVDRVQDKFPGYTLSQLNDGKLLYEMNCALCHDLMEPTSRQEDDWKAIVPDMVIKANRKNGNTLDADGEQLILRYVITMGPAQPR